VNVAELMPQVAAAGRGVVAAAQQTRPANLADRTQAALYAVRNPPG
jgi:hypothetical protein